VSSLTVSTHDSSPASAVFGGEERVHRQQYRKSPSSTGTSNRQLRQRSRRVTLALVVSLLAGVVFLALSLTVFRNDDQQAALGGTSGSSGGGSLGHDYPNQPDYLDDEEDEYVADDDDAIDDFYGEDLDDDDDGYGTDNSEATFEDMPPDQPLPATDKLAWPELVGEDADAAAATILAETQNQVQVFIIPEDSLVSADYRTDRVRVFINEENLVSRKPMIG